MALWSLKGKKVLIIDDFQEMRMMLRTILEPLTPEFIKLAKNGEEALELIEANSFDIIFCDYNLGKGKDGQQVLEEAKHRQLIGYSTIYIMVTAENTSEMVMGAIDYQPDDYISKPFNRTVIHGRLQKIMDKKTNLIEISKAIAEKNYKRTVTLCDQLLINNPSNKMDILKVKGEMLLKLGNYDAAVNFYEDIIEQRDIPWAYLSLARAHYMQEKYLEALETLEELVRENPSHVAAYDLLADIHKAMGDSGKAQDALNMAVSKSPKSLLRQRHLAEVAVINEDYETAQNAYEHALTVGQHSCFKQPDDYSALARTLVNSGKADDALKIVERIQSDFHKDSGAEMVAAITEGMVLTEKGNKEAAEKSLGKALELYKQGARGSSVNSTLELTSLCLSYDKTDQADELTKDLVRNHHEDMALIEKTKRIYSDAGKSDTGNDLIEKTKSEIVEINNKGARLLKEGKIEESIELFMKAAHGMPDNAIVNLNTAYSIIMQMQKSGKIKKYMPRAKKYLDRVYRLDPTNKKYNDMLEMIQQLAEKREAA